MADEDYDYDGDYFEDGDNFFYVEETYALADDLTENVIPDPGGFYDHTDDWDDMTRFDYWNDIEYDSDGYNDRAGLPVSKENQKIKHVAGLGKKRKATVEAEKVAKRPKLSRNMSTFMRELPPIMFISRLPEKPDPIVDVSKMKSYAILPDWRERFKNVKSVVDVSDKAIVPRVEDDEVLSDENLEEDLDNENDPSAAMEALSLSLESHLAKAGLDTSRIDRSKLLALAQKMMADDDDAEDLLADFIEDMYGDEGEEGDDAFAKWVTTSTEAKCNESLENGTHDLALPAQSKLREVQEPLFDPPRGADGKSSPRVAAPTSTTNGKKRKPESPDTSPKKRRNMNKRIPT